MTTKALLSTAVALGACGMAACGNRHRDKEPPPRDTRRTPRVIEPSTERVGPLPPYGIRADGVGPYKLGEKLSDLLEQLPSGPQIVLFEIPGLVHRNVIRAEDDAILIGGEQASIASFVAVVGSEVASVAGVRVGSTRDELIAALGPPVEDPERAHDPRLIAPSALPNLRVVVDAGGKLAAIVVTGTAASSRAVAECPRPAATERAVGACMTGTGELVAVSGDEVAIRTADDERALATLPKLPGLVFAAPLRIASEARDELVAITRTDEAATRTWWIAAYRLEGTRLLRTIDTAQLYQLSSANARWIGADLHDVELYLELSSRPDGIDVGGLLTTHSSSRTKTVADVVVIAPTQVARHRGKSAAAEASDAGVTGATPPGRVTQSAAPRVVDPAAADSEPAKH